MLKTLSVSESSLFALANANPMAHVLIGPTHSSLLLDGMLYVAERGAA